MDEEPKIERTPLIVANALLLATCETLVIYFFYLHLHTWVITTSATMSVISVVIPVVAVWVGPLKPILPGIGAALSRLATTFLVSLALVSILFLLFTTASVNIRLTDSAKNASVIVTAPGWKATDRLAVDSDRKEASRLYFFRFRGSDLVIAPIGDPLHGPRMEHCVLPFTSLAVRSRIASALTAHAAAPPSPAACRACHSREPPPIRTIRNAAPTPDCWSSMERDFLSKIGR